MAKYHTKDITVEILGQKKRIKVRAKSQKELDAKVLEWRIRERNGELTMNTETSFSMWASQWLDIYKKPSVSEKEHQRYEGAFKNYMFPALGGIKLKNLKEFDLQKYLNSLAGKSESFISFHHKTLRAIIKKAAKSNLLNADILDDLVVPKGTSTERRALTQTERIAFLNVGNKHPHSLMFEMMLACGIRPGELRALMWTNVNIKTGEVSITSAVKSGTNIIGQPKSKAGIRIVQLPEWYLSKLKEYAKNNKTSLYVFPSGGTGNLMTSQHFTRSWKSFKHLMAVELGAHKYRNKVLKDDEGNCLDKDGRIVMDGALSPYYLRHTYCTDLAAAGVPMKTAQYLMGHSSINITATIYSHYESSTRAASILKLNEYQLKQSKINSDEEQNEKKCRTCVALKGVKMG